MITCRWRVGIRLCVVWDLGPDDYGCRIPGSRCERFRLEEIQAFEFSEVEQ